MPEKKKSLKVNLDVNNSVIFTGEDLTTLTKELQPGVEKLIIREAGEPIAGFQHWMYWKYDN